MFLKDRKNECFELATDQHCRMHVLNGKTLSLSGNIPQLVETGVKTVRIDARAMALPEIAACVSAYRRELDGKLVELDRTGTTRGHFFRGVLTQA